MNRQRDTSGPRLLDPSVEVDLHGYVRPVDARGIAVLVSPPDTRSLVLPVFSTRATLEASCLELGIKYAEVVEIKDVDSFWDDVARVGAGQVVVDPHTHQGRLRFIRLTPPEDVSG